MLVFRARGDNLENNMFNLLDGSWDSERINKNEVLELLKFLTKHAACQKDLKIAVSGRNGIGQNVVVECSCGTQKDITNYNSW